MNADKASAQSSAHVHLVGEIQRGGGRPGEIARRPRPDSNQDSARAVVAQPALDGAAADYSRGPAVVAGMTGGDRVTRAIKACRQAGFPVIDPEGCSCGLSGRLVVLAGPDGLTIVWPFEQRCPIHGARDRERPQPVTPVRAGRSRSQAATRAWTQSKAGGR
jgi:hypothetical protein